jgi:ethanolamine ammonia-lyase large subunit
MAEQQTQMALEKEYLNTNQELQKTILEYKNKISKLKELKKELEIELKLTKEQLLKNQELIFIAKKYNKIKAINIDVKANE